MTGPGIVSKAGPGTAEQLPEQNHATESFGAEPVGVEKGATLMVTTPTAEDAARIARETELPVGLYVSLTEGRPVAEMHLHRLIDDCGAFKLRPQHLSRATRKDVILIDQIRAEIRAQLARAVDFGLALTHVDSHQHVHMNPAIFAVLEEEASAFGIRRIRFSREPLRVSIFLWRVFTDSEAQQFGKMADYSRLRAPD